MDLQASNEIPKDARHEDGLVNIITDFGQKSREREACTQLEVEVVSLDEMYLECVSRFYFMCWTEGVIDFAWLHRTK